MITQETVNKIIEALNANTDGLEKLTVIQNTVNRVLNLNTAQIDKLTEELSNKKRIKGFLK